MLGGAAAVAGMLAGTMAGAAQAQRPEPGNADPPGVVRDGHARFQVLTSGLIRMEYAGDDRFWNGDTMNVVNREFPAVDYDTYVEDGWRVIRTDDVELRYRKDSGRFTPHNTEVRLAAGDRDIVARPRWWSPLPGRSPENLGGWFRGLDNQVGSVPMHDGLLSKQGWYLLDDSRTAVPTRDGWARPRPDHDGGYRDGYLFAYGHDYANGLRDLKELTGSAPLLPEALFGVWFSKWYPYSATEHREIVERFRTEDVPLDVLVLDTDWKAPNAWTGWSWNRELFPDPEGFLDWAHDQGLLVSLNTHPSIRKGDPRYQQADQRAGGLINSLQCPWFQPPLLEGCGVFDFAKRAHAESYFALHDRFDAQGGVDFWWPDWCCDDSRVTMPGLTADSWLNQLYADRARQQGERGITFSRIGASYQQYGADPPAGPWADHRNAMHFTGDTFATWSMLRFQVRFTVAEGNIGLPYVTHDIGSFRGQHLPDDLYLRWLQFGVFQPVLRLHSDHGDRLPWEYGERTERIAEDMLRLRDSLRPYLYTTARQAHDTGLPMTRGMYLTYPEHEQAYEYDQQYLLGDDMLVAPVAKPGETATKRVWFPPGEWVDFFTGETYEGSSEQSVTVPLDRVPVFVRAGGVIPTKQGVSVFAGVDGEAELYEDAGDGTGYRRGEFARTSLRYTESGAGDPVLTIGPRRGSYPGMPGERSWTIRLVDSSGVRTVTPDVSPDAPTEVPLR